MVGEEGSEKRTDNLLRNATQRSISICISFAPVNDSITGKKVNILYDTSRQRGKSCCEGKGHGGTAMTYLPFEGNRQRVNG